MAQMTIFPYEKHLAVIIQKRRTEIDGLIQKTFEKNCAGLLPDSVMANLMNGYEQEKITLDDGLSSLRIEKLRAESQSADISKELDKLRQHADISQLNRAIVTSLIKSIHISEPTVVDGEKQYAIEIRYKFQNALNTKKENPSANEFSDGSCAAVS